MRTFKEHSKRHVVSICLLFVLTAAPATSIAADSLNWRTNESLVSADIKSEKLSDLLEQIASITHWQIFLEPNTTHQVSAKFKNLTPGEALHLLLGDINFALLPQTNASPRLYVFRTSQQNATVIVRAAKPADSGQGKIIPNELIVRLKPGAKIDELARSLGAKVVGQIGSLNAYRLRFDDEAAAEAARSQLATNSDVSSVDSNYSMDRPPAPGQVVSTTVPPPQLQLKPPPDNGKLIVGLVDTAVQPLGDNLDKFLLKQLSAAGTSDTPAPADPNSPLHGTAMAETILRSLQAVTKGDTSVQILPVDVYGGGETTSTFDVANGIAQAVNGGAKVINLSLGSTGDSAFLHSVIQDATKDNIVLFAAAGNQPVTTPFYPAAYGEVHAVTAIDQGQIASYANRGSFVQYGAPGTSVIYLNNQPFYVSGTSTSTAIISGWYMGTMDMNGGNAGKAMSTINSQFGVKIGK